MTITKAAAIGGGVIGGGWIARLALNGHDVTVFDPHPEAKRKVDEVMKNARRAYKRMAKKGLPKEGKVTFAKSIAEAVSGADFIQESVPERLDVKLKTLAEIEAAAPADALIGSSTSGFKATDMAKDMKHPERFLVAHPFNPVYLLPINEIVPGEKTSKKFVERAREVYTAIGMKCVVINKEIDAFVGNRLLEAAWREALWLVKDGVCTVEELDDIMRYGFGLRWAQMGMFQTYRIAGGEAGMRHFMAQFGPALAWPWTKLMDVPEFNDELVDLIATQSDDQSSKWSIRELERIRDDNLVSIYEGLARHGSKGWGAGELHKDYVKRLGAAAPKKKPGVVSRVAKAAGKAAKAVRGAVTRGKKAATKAAPAKKSAKAKTVAKKPAVKKPAAKAKRR
ncbi:MAG: L-carnitine dehydrogenase [Rhizobiaceae bacterium]|nr:L-carnitine dehydrogenase [Rhizobiaceae bacterium]